MVQIVRAWAGIMGFTAAGVPLLGRVGDQLGLTLVVGFNGGGFSWAAVTGQVIAALIAGRDSGFDLAPFAPYRFATTRTAWSNPFTAGETNASIAV